MSLDVLVVEDSEFMRDLLTETLSDDHDVVATAENGVEAVELYEEHDPDVVMMDIVMPVKDGVEATGEITEADPEADVIMCTSVGQEEKMKAAVQAGAEGYITKPFQGPQVLAEIEEVAG
ncbi:MAG: response regulator [Haloferacaceae archaeon]